MALSEVEKERKNDLEKLIDWEQNKQLTWAVVLLTSTLGLAGLFVGNSFAMNDTLIFVLLLALTLMLVLDISFYRLVTSLAILGTYVEWIGVLSPLIRQELVTNVLFRRLYAWFVYRADENERFPIRRLRIGLVIVLADFFIVSYTWVMILRR